MSSAMICRPGHSDRFFPPIAAELYRTHGASRELSPSQLAALWVLSLARRKFSRWERLLGWSLDGPGRVGRMLLQHRMAMDSELSGQWRRADFFWRESHGELKALSRSRRPAVWRELLEATARDEDLAGAHSDEWRRRIVNELFIDTHCALYNGRIVQAGEWGPGDRAFRHGDYLDGLLAESDIPLQDQLGLLSPIAERLIQVCIDAKQWNDAVAACRRILDRFPDATSFQQSLARVLVAKTIAGLTDGESEQASLQDARTLSKGIDSVEAMREQWPLCRAAVSALAHLHHIRAIKLANGHRVSDSLVEIEKALIYDPYGEGISETRRQLEEALGHLQAKMRAILADLATRPNTRLNSSGWQLKAQADRGLEPARAFAQGAEAESLRAEVRAAEACEVWRIIGLPIPQGGWQEQAVALLRALQSIAQVSSDDPDGIAGAWQQQLVAAPELASLDHAAICRFLEHRLFGGESDQPAAQGTEPDTEVPGLAAPILTPSSSVFRPKLEPFAPWLLSRQDRLVKLLAVAAVLLILMASNLWIREMVHREYRDVAYRELIEAENHNESLRVVERAEAFLSAGLLGREDAREPQVRELYSKALVRWALSTTGDLIEEGNLHLRRYRALMPASEQEDGSP